MWSRTHPILTALILAACACPAAARDFRGVEFDGPAHGRAYGYAGSFVRGDDIGAPLTRVPRPSQIVPAPWSYGTYGIPTVSGIYGTPAGQPTLTIINARGPKASPPGGGASAGRAGSTDARIIQVEVPRR